MKVFVWTSVILLSAISAASCSKGSSASPSSPSGNTQFTINITGQNGALSFSPNPADAGGKSVVFKNNDSVTHHIALNDGSVDAGDIAPGATSKAVIMPTGGANYHCTIHANMGGSIDAANGGMPPACEGPYCY